MTRGGCVRGYVLKREYKNLRDPERNEGFLMKKVHGYEILHFVQNDKKGYSGGSYIHVLKT